MKKEHRTKDGEVMLIAQMTGDHLLATIDMYCNRIKEAVDLVDKLATLKESEKILYGLTNPKGTDTVKLAGVINQSAEGLVPYVLEASIRGLHITAKLQAAFGRKEAIPKFNSLMIGTDKKISDAQIIDTNYDENPF